MGSIEEKRQELIRGYSDFYKEAHGFRPRYKNVEGMTYEELSSEYEYLTSICNENEIKEKARHEKGVSEFETLLARTMTTCNCTIDDAVRFLMDAEDCQGDWGYFCYLNDLPYSYSIEGSPRTKGKFL